MFIVLTGRSVRGWNQIMSWRQFVMNLESLDPHIAERALEKLGAQSITLSDAGDDPVLEPGPGETPLWQSTRVTALFAGDTDINQVRMDLRQELDIAELPANYDESLADTAWEREWLKDFAPMQFGRRLWVAPAGMRVDADDAIVVELDPGLAFGTGTHATTAMCLEWLEQRELKGKRVLDLGCGSGILAIAALKLGAASVHAIDIDLQAVTATRQNAHSNVVDEQLFVATDLESAPGPFDVVVANILAGTLIELAGEICGRLVSGGELALSGILSAQADEVEAAYQDQIGFAMPAQTEDWARLAGVRH